MWRVLILVAALVAAVPSLARASDETACTAAIAVAERKLAVPPRVLGAIAIVESGRAVGKRVVPWPWSINVEGVGRYYASKQEAIEAAKALHSAGLRSIDVGCMQINLAAHPTAFDSLEDAFDPAINADYAARFLHALYRQTGQIAKAMTAYHSQTPVFAADYARRLLAVWPGAAALGLDAPSAPPLEPPSNLSPEFARLIARDRANLRRHQPNRSTTASPRSSLELVSARGAAWPTSKR